MNIDTVVDVGIGVVFGIFAGIIIGVLVALAPDDSEEAGPPGSGSGNGSRFLY